MNEIFCRLFDVMPMASGAASVRSIPGQNQFPYLQYRGVPVRGSLFLETGLIFLQKDAGTALPCPGSERSWPKASAWPDERLALLRCNRPIGGTCVCCAPRARMCNAFGVERHRAVVRSQGAPDGDPGL